VIEGDQVAAGRVDLTLVIPCFNEEENIAATLDTVEAAMSTLLCNYQILVIDDGSTDRTVDVVEAYKESHRGLPIRIHKNAQNRGLTRSYVDGAFLGQGSIIGSYVEITLILRKLSRRYSVSLARPT
jgi:glycosyltransferase involved in cell wall biosynthesis